MSHPSIQSETSRPVSDAALCMFALLTPVASAPAFVFSPNICRVCDCPHGRYEIKAKKTWEELFYWSSGLSWHRSMFTLALKIHLRNKALTSLIMRQQKKKNTLMMYKMPYQSYSKVCHWCFIHLSVYLFILCTSTNALHFYFPPPTFFSLFSLWLKSPSHGALTRSLGYRESATRGLTKQKKQHGSATWWASQRTE